LKVNLTFAVILPKKEEEADGAGCFILRKEAM
jgi:hypothetical protein